MRTGNTLRMLESGAAESPMVQYLTAGDANNGAVDPYILSGSEIIVLQAVEQFVRYTGVRPSTAHVQEAAAFARSAG